MNDKEQKSSRKPRKRANGEGSIRKRPDGTWEGRVTVTDINGNKSRPSFYGKKQEDVRKQIDEAVSLSDRGLYVASNKLTLENYLLNDWLWGEKHEQLTADPPKLKPKTFDGYFDSINNHIKGTRLGKMAITDVRRHHIQNWIKEKSKAGTRDRALSSAYGVIRNGMNDAVRNGILKESYADKITLPRKKAATTKILTKHEQNIFLKAINSNRLEAAFYVALTTGIREGELTALSWSDFDEDQGTLTISKDAVRIYSYDEKTMKKTGSKVIIQDSPKSAAGNRTIPLLPDTIKSLKRHRQRQNIEKMKNRKLYQENNLIFCDEMGRLYDPKNFYTTLRKFCKEIEGLDHIKFHALRHTFATRALESDMKQKAVQGLLGHETAAMTMHYTHLLDEQKKIEMEKLKDAFKI